MTEVGAGFRFDIYERIHFPEDRPAIGELEQIELLPFVRGVPGQEQSHLKGYLQLTAVYAPRENGERQTFSHRIPVEISLPARAEGKDEDVEVNIEQFDVDLVSSRSLNVTGVLSLSGWSPQELVQAEVRSTDHATEAQEMIAEYEAETRKPKPKKAKPQSDQIEVVADTETLEPSASPFALEAAAPPEGFAPPPLWEQKLPEAAPVLFPYGEAPAAQQQKPHDASQESHDASQEESGSWQDFETESLRELEQAQDQVQEPLTELQETSAAPIEDAPPLTEPVSGNLYEESFSAEQALHLEPKVAIKPQQHERTESGEELAAKDKTNNELEWRKLFFGGGDETPFKTMRMCIVQKEETIETIAERYQLHPREIALYNRLGEADVSEGQILYIPL